MFSNQGGKIQSLKDLLPQDGSDVRRFDVVDRLYEIFADCDQELVHRGPILLGPGINGGGIVAINGGRHTTNSYGDYSNPYALHVDGGTGGGEGGNTFNITSGNTSTGNGSFNFHDGDVNFETVFPGWQNVFNNFLNTINHGEQIFKGPVQFLNDTSGGGGGSTSLTLDGLLINLTNGYANTISRIQLTSNLSAGLANAKRLRWNNNTPAYETAGNDFGVRDPFGEWGGAKSGYRGYAAYFADRSVWEILHLEHKAWYILGTLNGTLNPTSLPDGTVVKAWGGESPGVGATVSLENTADFTGVTGDMFRATYDSANDVYVLDWVEC